MLNEFVLDIKNLQTFDQIERAKFKKTTDQLASDAKRLNRNRIFTISAERNWKKLFDDGLIQFEQYHALIDRVDQAEDKIIADERMTVSDLKEQRAKDSTETRELLQKELGDQLISEVDLLKSQLADQGKLISSVPGRVVEVTSSVGDYLSPGSPVILVQPDAEVSELTFVFIS